MPLAMFSLQCAPEIQQEYVFSEYKVHFRWCVMCQVLYYIRSIITLSVGIIYRVHIDIGWGIRARVVPWRDSIALFKCDYREIVSCQIYIVPLPVNAIYYIHIFDSLLPSFSFITFYFRLFGKWYEFPSSISRMCTALNNSVENVNLVRRDHKHVPLASSRTENWRFYMLLDSSEQSFFTYLALAFLCCITDGTLILYSASRSYMGENIIARSTKVWSKPWRTNTGQAGAK